MQTHSIGKTILLGGDRYAAEILEGLKKRRKGCIQLNEELFYVEWTPNTTEKRHRYLVAFHINMVFAARFPRLLGGRKPILEEVVHHREAVVQAVHRMWYSGMERDITAPELHKLCETTISGIKITPRIDGGVWIEHKNGKFFSMSTYGQLQTFETVPCSSERTVYRNSDHWRYIEKDGKTLGIPPAPPAEESQGTTTLYLTDFTGMTQLDPRHPYYQFIGAVGVVRLHEGEMVCYPDGSIRFLPKPKVGAPVTRFPGMQSCRQIQGDLTAYVFNADEADDSGDMKVEGHINRHTLSVSTGSPALRLAYPKRDNWEASTIWVHVMEDCTLTVKHPEHGTTTFAAKAGEYIALLPGTSRPFQRVDGRD